MMRSLHSQAEPLRRIVRLATAGSILLSAALCLMNGSPVLLILPAMLGLVFFLFLPSWFRPRPLISDNLLTDLIQNEQLFLILLNAGDQKILYISPGGDAYFDSDGKTWDSGFSQQDRETLERDFNETLGGENQQSGEFRLSCRNDVETWLSIRMYGIRTGERAGQVAIVCRDVTEDRNSRLQLVKAREYEIEVGARIQQSLLLGRPPVQTPGIVIDTFTLPSQKIDGDFIDFFNDSIMETSDFLLGDVMGKGVPAALMGAAARSEIMKAHCLSGTNSESGHRSGTDSPASILSLASTNLAGELQKLKSFVTLVYGRLKNQGRILEFVDCGHTSMIHYDAAAESCWRLKGADMPLGFSAAQNFTSYMADLGPEDIIFAYSDGITEAVNSENELFGEERLMLLIRASHNLSPGDLLNKIKQITFAYCGGNFRDDITCIALKVQDQADSPGRKIIQKEFAHNLDSIREIRMFFAESLNLLLSTNEAAAAAEEINIAAAEAVSNILRHQAPTDSSLKITLRRTASWLAIHLEYSGEEYNWQDIAIPDAESYQLGGYGQYLMNTVMDSVILEQGEHQRQRLVMIKSLKEESL